MIKFHAIEGALQAGMMMEQGIVEGSSSIKRDLKGESGVFVFGDSYADTGNHDPESSPLYSVSWKPPYGITWPGIPTGRFSDGRVLTDFFGKAP